MKVSKKIINLETESAFAILAKATKLISEGKDIINLGIGQPDFPTPSNIQEAAIKAIKDGYHGYTPSNGILPLREAVSEKINKDYKVNVNPDEILITPGGKPTIFYSCLILGGEENEIIYPDPGFPIYRSMINFSGARGIPLKLAEEDNFEINIEKLEQLITNKTSLIIINNPNNPTGAFMNQFKIEKIVKMLEKYPEVFVLSDEIYSKIIFEDEKMPSLLSYEILKERLIVLEGWSKAYSMTGWRLGWSYWPKEMIPHVNKLLINSVSCVNAAAQFAGIAALDGPDDSIKDMLDKFTLRRNLIHKGLNDLPGIECSLPGGAFYAFPKVIGTGMNGSEFCKKAMHEAGVAIVPGTAFGKTCQDYVRFSFAASRDNIQQALENIGKMLSK